MTRKTDKNKLLLEQHKKKITINRKKINSEWSYWKKKKKKKKKNQSKTSIRFAQIKIKRCFNDWSTSNTYNSHGEVVVKVIWTAGFDPSMSIRGMYFHFIFWFVKNFTWTS